MEGYFEGAEESLANEERLRVGNAMDDREKAEV